jgi:NAD(P)H-nitrite reductase large subunit
VKGVIADMSRIIDRTSKNEPFEEKLDDDIIICRCEEITKGEIRKAVHDGMSTMNEIKRYLRSGMGLCQGQTCARIVRGIIANELGVNPYEIELSVPRSPARPVPMDVFGRDDNVTGEK